MGRSSLLVCAFVIEKGSGRMLDLTVLKDGKIKKTYLFSEDTTFRVSIQKDGMLRKGKLLALFTVGEEVYSVPDIQNGGVYALPAACIGMDFYVRIVNDYPGGLTETEQAFVKSVMASSDKSDISFYVSDGILYAVYDDGEE